MAVKKPEVVYGGPYSDESDAILSESTREKPNYEKLISGWKTVSQGALDAIKALENPVAPEDGPFVENVILEKEEEVTEEKTEEKTEGQTEVDLDKL